jgi:hypothetical protein
MESFGFKSILTADSVKLVNTSTTTVFKNDQDQQEHSLNIAKLIEKRYSNYKSKVVYKMDLNEHSSINGITFSNGCLRLYDNVNHITYIDDAYTKAEYLELSNLISQR